MLITPAYAQAATAAAPGPFAAIAPFLPIILIFLAGYVLLIRPQMQQQKKQRASIDAVKKGDEVVTAGGLVGKVTRVTPDEVEVEIAPNTRVRVVKATLAEVRPLGGARPAND